MGPFGQANVGPISQTNVGPFGQANVGPISQANVGPFGQANVGPISRANVGPFGQANVGPISRANVGPLCKMGWAHRKNYTWCQRTSSRRSNVCMLSGLGLHTALTTLIIEFFTFLLQQLDVTYRCVGNYSHKHALLYFLHNPCKNCIVTRFYEACVRFSHVSHVLHLNLLHAYSFKSGLSAVVMVIIPQILTKIAVYTWLRPI